MWVKWASHRLHRWTGKPIVSNRSPQRLIRDILPTFELDYVEAQPQPCQVSMKEGVADLVDNSVMTRLAGCYNP